MRHGESISGSLLPDENDEGRDPPQTPAPNPQQAHLDCDGDALHKQRDQQDKAIQTAIAKAAIAGYTLHVVDDGGGGSCFRIGRWALSRTLADLDEVEAFLVRAGAGSRSEAQS